MGQDGTAPSQSGKVGQAKCLKNVSEDCVFNVQAKQSLM